jgi:hypothetical protein
MAMLSLLVEGHEEDGKFIVSRVVSRLPKTDFIPM